MTASRAPRIIVLAPVRDEAAALPRFLSAALLWADAVIVADQHSTDRSVEIARSFPRVTVIENPDRDYGEESRQQLLIDAARRLFPGPRVLVALDADELLSAGVLHSGAWRSAVASDPGTCICLGRAELCESLSEYFIDWAADQGKHGTFAYVDDGVAHQSGRLHAARIPESAGAPRILLDDVTVLHYARGNMTRLKSRERWYQCFERLHHPDRTDVEIRRRYDWYERLRATYVERPCPDAWFAGYRDGGVDLEERRGDDVFWTDWEVLQFFARHSIEPFRFLDIWDIDWEAMRRRAIAAGIDGVPQQPLDLPHAVHVRWVRAILQRSMRWRCRRLTDGAMSRLLRRPGPKVT